MNDAASKHILIVGAGLAGSLLARGLADLGYRVSVYERRPDPRVKLYGGGRSINLALSARGITGLKRVQLYDRMMAHALPMPGRMIHAADGGLMFQPYSKDPADAIYSVSRGGLNIALLQAAGEHPNVSLRFDERCLDIDPEVPAAVFENSGTGEQTRIEADLILGGDGAFSAVRGRLQRNDRFEYSQSYLAHGYKELHIPPTASGQFAMDPKALHIWPRGGAMMIALPNTDRSFTCTLFWPFEGDHGLNSLRSEREIREFFERHYADAMPLMPTLIDDYQRNPNGSLVTVRCWPWSYKGRVAVLGDAAHAIVPFFGQGMNCAFEDCVTLLDLLQRYGPDFARVLAEFEAVRKPNADAIADMALDNFVEMRDKVGKPEFLHRKKLEHIVHELFPDRLAPKYNLVSFSTVPYVEAKRAGRRLDEVLDHLEVVFPQGTRLEDARERVRAEVEAILTRRQAGTRARNAESGPRLIDISPMIDERIAVWPGDTPMSREVLCDMAKGSNITLSTLRSTVHLGSHADGHNHYGHPAPSIADMPLEHYVGVCELVDARVQPGARVRLADLRSLPAAPRVLIRTGTYPDPAAWRTDFAGLDPELIEALHRRGVITIGVDAPSVDLFESKDLPAHQVFLKHRIAILEGLSLAGVAAGTYELIAAPLKLAGFDASPVRAILRPI